MAQVVGITGNAPQYGQMSTGEYLKDLSGVKGRAIFDEMRRSDPVAKAGIAAVSLPIVQSAWNVQPASQDTGDAKVRDFVESCLLKDKMSTTWRSVLQHVMLMSPFGFSAFEQVWARGDLGVVLDKLDPRLPQSVSEWKYDDAKRALTALVQTDPKDGKSILVPIEKCVVFTNQREGDNWEGISDLRAAYGSWWMKQTLLKINMIKHDRFGAGTPVGEAPEGVSETHESFKTMELALQELYAMERGYINMPSGWKVSLLSTGQNAGTDAIPSIKYLDERMLVAFLAQFLSLGSSETGSRALGESFVDFFLLALQERAEYIADIFNRFVIKPLVDYNFDVDEYPKLEPGRLRPLALTALAQLATSGVLTKEITLENTVREQLGIEELEAPEEAVSEADESAIEVTEPETDEQEQEQEEPEEQDEPEQPTVKSRVSVRDGAVYMAGTLRRELKPQELVCDWPSMIAKLDRSVDTVARSVKVIREDQVDKLALLLSGGRRVRDIVVPGKKDQYDLLVAAYDAMKSEGRADVVSEIRKQRPGLSPKARARMTTPLNEDEYDALMQEEMSLAVEGASDKLKAMMAAMYISLRKEGVRGDELRTRLMEKARESIGDRTWDNMAHLATNEGYGRGRDDAARDYADEIETAYRSGVMDTGICGVCLDKDGESHEWGDPEWMAPDPECEGGPRCRCVNIAVMRAEGAPE